MAVSTIKSGTKAVKVTVTNGDADLSWKSVVVYNNPQERTVRVYCSFRATTTIPTTASIAVIPAGIRPNSNAGLAGVLTTSVASLPVTAYYGMVDTNGKIRQALGATVTGGVLVGEYSY